MSHLVNLLPWRRQRYVKALRWWGIALTICLLSFCVLVINNQLGFRLQHRVFGSLVSNNQQAIQQFRQQTALRQEMLNQRQNDMYQIDQQARLQRAGHDWQNRLQQLAMLMPGNAWLSSLVVHDNGLVLSGESRSLDSISVVAGILPGTVSPGPLRRNEHGNWFFSFHARGVQQHDTSD